MARALHQLFYVSQATADCREGDIARILATARRRNRQLDVTGCLLHAGDCFAQALEGDADRIGELVDRIAADKRHGGLRILLSRNVARRSFTDWAMGYVYDLGKLERLRAALSADTPPSVEQAMALMGEMRLDPIAGGYC